MPEGVPGRAQCALLTSVEPFSAAFAVRLPMKSFAVLPRSLADIAERSLFITRRYFCRDAQAIRIRKKFQQQRYGGGEQGLQAFSSSQRKRRAGVKRARRAEVCSAARVQRVRKRGCAVSEWVRD